MPMQQRQGNVGRSATNGLRGTAGDASNHEQDCQPAGTRVGLPEQLEGAAVVLIRAGHFGGSNLRTLVPDI